MGILIKTQISMVIAMCRVQLKGRQICNEKKKLYIRDYIWRKVSSNVERHYVRPGILLSLKYVA